MADLYDTPDTPIVRDIFMKDVFAQIGEGNHDFTYVAVHGRSRRTQSLYVGGSDFTGSSLYDLFVKRGGMGACTFTGTYFVSCNFEEVDFSTATFRGAVFQNCFFVDCLFIGCDFSGANMEKASFDDCRFEGVTFSRETTFSSTSHAILSSVLYHAACPLTCMEPPQFLPMMLACTVAQKTGWCWPDFGKLLDTLPQLYPFVFETLGEFPCLAANVRYLRKRQGRFSANEEHPF